MPILDLDRFLCDCGHTLHDHSNGRWPDACEEFVFNALLDACGHVHGECDCGRPPPASSVRRPRGKLPFRQVWDRDGWQCVTCGTHKNLTVDHIVPVSRGGTDDLPNLQTMCGPCNSSKGARV